MKTWARAVLANEESGKCHLRHGDVDEMHELCDLINRVAEPMLARNQTESEEDSAGEDSVPESRAA